MFVINLALDQLGPLKVERRIEGGHYAWVMLCPTETVTV